ncbi:transglycosylase domain-containing protein [Candidatus Woesebacteria bacterium]|nr:transglycosylase domain-containing protein [Candidatus Woesebacteria bacterium]
MFRKNRSDRANSRLIDSRTRQLNRKLFWVRLIRFSAFAFVGAVILGIMAFFALFAFYSQQLPKPGEVVRKTGFSTKIYDRNGAFLYDLYADERRTPINIADVPDYVKKASIAVEDKDFYQHQGFDLLTLVRIPYNYVFKKGRVVGGSTLTQQLVKNVLLTNERSVARKFKEFVLALQLERTFSKDQILEMYLNEAPYGGTAWGIGTASEVYFNKKVSDLTLIEGAILAGLPQRPSAYSPYAGKTDENGELLWKIRTKGVLRRMKEDGYLTDLAYEQALQDLEKIQFSGKGVDIKAPHFVFYVRNQLEKMYGENLVDTAGFKVTTSLDYDLQEKAQKIVYDEIEKVKDVNITNGAVMVINPKTGEILCMVGSKDYNSKEIDGQFNVAVDGLRQPGSSIKPVTYLALLHRGYTPASMFADVPTSFVENATQKAYEPKNYDGKFRGPVDLRESLGSSLNIPAVKALAIVGLNEFLTQAHDMGFVTLAPSAANMKRFGLAVTLGGAEVHMIDTASAYSAFANGGTRVEPVSILKVEDHNGHVIFEHKNVPGPTVMSPEEAFLINTILSDNNARAIAFGTRSLLNVNPNVAVKTGTTNDQRDNWAVGWSQEVLVTAWVGNNDNSAMKRVASGVSGATPIWRQVILAALDSKKYSAPAWVKPAGITQAEVDRISGYPAHDDFLKKNEYFIQGTLPPLPDPFHLKLKLCKGENKLANDARVAAGDFEEKEFIIMKEDDPVSKDGINRWQDGINAWVTGQTDGKYKPPTDYCGEQNEVFVEVKRPENEKKYDSEDIEIEVVADAGDGIEKIELWVDGALRETINGHEYKGKIHLNAGQHEIFAKARSKSGKEKTSSTRKIGTGGQDWKKPEPTSTPTPTPTPTVSPTPSPSPT